MPNIAVVNVDTVGTGLIQDGATKTFLSGRLVAVVGSHIASHSGHTGATISDGSVKVFVEGKKLARVGDPATCAHTVDTGNAKAFSG